MTTGRAPKTARRHDEAPAIVTAYRRDEVKSLRQIITRAGALTAEIAACMKNAETITAEELNALASIAGVIQSALADPDFSDALKTLTQSGRLNAGILSGDSQ